jgi:hypothetical protein
VSEVTALVGLAVEGTGGTNTFDQVPTTNSQHRCNHSSPKAKTSPGRGPGTHQHHVMGHTMVSEGLHQTLCSGGYTNAQRRVASSTMRWGQAK